MPHVSVERLRVVYRDEAGGETAAIEEASFAIERGASLGIVGESGSGKSTAARTLLGFMRPGARLDAGSVHLGDTDVFALEPTALRQFRGGRAAMVPQNPLSSLTPHRTIGRQMVELIGLHAGLRGAEAKERALELMAETNLPEPRVLFDRYPHEISGGQRQRVVIAAALVARPELIVLDEPTTALDKTVEARVLDLVRRVQADLGATLVYVSHDLNVISAMCDDIVVMKGGRVVERGSTEAIFSGAQSSYTQSLIRAIPRLQTRSRPQPPAGPAVLRTEGLVFGYKARGGFLRRKRSAPPALSQLNITVGPQETLGIVGESGSGKSTLASLIAGALAGHQGEMQFAGAPLTGLAKHRTSDARRRVQMVFQDPLSSLNPAHTIQDILTRPLRLYFGHSPAEAKARAEALLAELELGPEILARRPRQLSGGQQQRVALARALSAEPDLLLCDEITSALDVTIQAQVLALLQRLQQQRGIACLFITHDLAVVSEIADTLLVLEQGQVRDYGPTVDIIANPKTAYTEKLISAFRRNEREPLAAPLSVVQA